MAEYLHHERLLQMFRGCFSAPRRILLMHGRPSVTPRTVVVPLGSDSQLYHPYHCLPAEINSERPSHMLEWRLKGGSYQRPQHDPASESKRPHPHVAVKCPPSPGTASVLWAETDREAQRARKFSRVLDVTVSLVLPPSLSSDRCLPHCPA